MGEGSIDHLKSSGVSIGYVDFMTVNESRRCLRIQCLAGGGYSVAGETSVAAPSNSTPTLIISEPILPVIDNTQA